VRLATNMLAKEEEYWWMNSSRHLGASGVRVSWEMFKEVFFKKYFPADVRSKKEIEFLELKRGSMYVVEYAAKFEELYRFCPYINAKGVKASKYIKFESGLRP